MDSELNKRFGKVVARLRRQRGMSQESLDGAIHRTYLSEIERGLKSPTLSTISKLAQALGVPPAFLVELATTATGLGAENDRSQRRGLAAVL